MLEYALGKQISALSRAPLHTPPEKAPQPSEVYPKSEGNNYMDMIILSALLPLM